MHLDLRTEFSKPLLLLIQPELLDPILRFCNISVLSFVEREFATARFKPEVTVQELATILDQMCDKVSVDLTKAMAENGFEFAVPKLSWDSPSSFILLLSPVVNYGAPSTLTH
jgi:hypothetical protein